MTDELDPALTALLRAEGLPESYLTRVRRLHAPLAARIAAMPRPVRVGVAGPQGSGKSTDARILDLLLRERGLRAVTLSLDDLYLSRATRARLGAQVHPLLATRGVPGTHDVALGVDVLGALGGAGEVRLPRFDKARDDLVPRSDWPTVRGAVDVILFEGWCVGAAPQLASALRRPVNALERGRDPNRVWRTYVNDQLAGPYRALFAGLAPFVFLRAPSFDVVLRWRSEQEHKLRARRGSDAGMSDADLAVFIQHYERLTRWMLREAPARADVVVRLDQHREIRGVSSRPPTSAPSPLAGEGVSEADG